MKSLFLVSAAVAALAAAPALAQDGPVGSVGVTWSNAEANLGPLSGDAESYGLDGAVALPAFGDWTVTLGASTAQVDGGSDDTAFAGNAHLTRVFGGDLRAGGFVAYSDVADESAVTVGAEVQKYLSGATLTGVAAYTTVDDDDADVWTFGGDAAFYPLANLRLNAGVSYNKIEAGAADADAWVYGVGGEYQIGSTPFSVTAGYNKADIEELEVDTWTLGLRYAFGGGLQARDRAGANLAGAGLQGVLGAF